MLENFKSKVLSFLDKKRVIEDEVLRYAYSTDASLYRMVPKLVLIVNTEKEVQEVIKLASEYDIKLTFRAAGTSLSGQAVTDQVLVMLASNSWLNYEIYDDGKKIKLEPSIIGAEANKYLKIYDRKIGPDPGSINTAKIGGIVSNNSSGMCCGTAKNTYSTIDSMQIVFADGSTLGTANQPSIDKFKNDKKEFIDSLVKIRKEIINDENIVKFIKKKFSIKNTSGYSLNAFLEFEDPIKIIERLLIGSEGTLGFVSSVTLNTVPDYKYKALNLIYGKLEDLVNLTVDIEPYNISSIELLDYLSLKSVADQKGLGPYLIELKDESYAAIMIDLAEGNKEILESKLEIVNKAISKAAIISQTGFKQNAKEMQIIWKARSGVLPTIAGQRPLGSSVLIEDIAVEIEKLPMLIADVKEMFKKYSYNNAAIFGHVLAGNIHFVLTPNFNNQEEILNYDNFMHELTELVAKKFNGSLKAEHGSGRNISPFAIVEWGEKCWDIMWQIKRLFDPKNIFNPDVKLTKDNTLHTKNLKEFDSVHPEIDKCMECGFCEPVCPSRNLSFTPRQRNSVARKINSLTGQEKDKWQEVYNYYGVETCATTSLCKTSCPVGIDTGAFILTQKPQYNKLVKHEKEIKIAKQKVQLGNLVGSVLGKDNLYKLTSSLHTHFKSIPVYLVNMPDMQKAKFVSSSNQNNKKVLLLPSCPNRIFASSRNYDKYPSQLILEKIGYEVEYPKDLNKQCCGQMYHSKGNNLQQEKSRNLLESIISNKYEAVIIDNSSCSSFAKVEGINIVDINSFILENLSKDSIKKKYNRIALHIDCSTRKQNLNEEYLQILELCCNDGVVSPERIYCCGFAGDKGFSIPELNSSSLESLKPQIEGCDVGVTFNRSCQIGLSKHSGIEYISFVELVLDCI